MINWGESIGIIPTTETLLVNLFVPSGVGQVAVRGPIMIEASKALNFSVNKTLMAIACGDAWTNMLQPFWV